MFFQAKWKGNKSFQKNFVGLFRILGVENGLFLHHELGQSAHEKVRHMYQTVELNRDLSSVHEKFDV